MTDKLSESLINISTMMMVATERGEMVRLASELAGLVENALEIEKLSNTLPQKKRTATLSTSIKFTHKEIEKMSQAFKKEFIANGLVARVIKRPSGKNGFYYEIRYRRNGYNITVSHKSLETAKALFVAKTVKLDPADKVVKSKLKFGNVLSEWLEYKQGKIAKSTTDGYASLANRYLPKEFLNSDITKIRTADIDRLMRQFDEEPRKYEDMRTVLNSTFKYAIASGIITHNPVMLIPFKRADRNPREALTDEQILIFLHNIQNKRYDGIRQCAYVLYFFGLRPCEIDDEAHFENGFLIARNRKRKGGRVEYKKIPMPKQAQGLIEPDAPIAPKLSYDRWLDLMKEALPDGLTPYNLRHTFATRCSEPTDIKPEIVDLWMGDSPTRLVGKHYVHYSDDFLREKMNLVHFPIL